MQSTDIEEIKAALWEQASYPCTQVSWGVAQVMAVRCRKGQLLALLRGVVVADVAAGGEAERAQLRAEKIRAKAGRRRLEVRGQHERRHNERQQDERKPGPIEDCPPRD